jgi:hypothetical protein
MSIEAEVSEQLEDLYSKGLITYKTKTIAMFLWYKLDYILSEAPSIEYNKNGDVALGWQSDAYCIDVKVASNGCVDIIYINRYTQETKQAVFRLNQSLI